MVGHERIDGAPQSTESEADGSAVSFENDPRQYTEEELMADPAKRYYVNPQDYPILSCQAEMGPNYGDKLKVLPIDETMSRYATNVADTVAVLAGEDNGLNSNKLPAADHVIYLDKSARPVSWLVNIFWKDFSDKKRPEHSYLAIDRKMWFGRTKSGVGVNEYTRDPDGSSHVATFRDFRTENITDEDIARIRALYIPGGIKSENIEEIMKTPTSLVGKNITIIDEVSRSGATLEIAKYLISRAIPEAASVNGYAFWPSYFQHKPNSQARQLRSVPVWYDSKDSYGRGIGDVNEEFFRERYENHPNDKTRAQRFGAIALGEYVNLSEEPNNSSRELMKEFQKMHDEWVAGHILMANPSHYDRLKWRDQLMNQGVRFVPQEGNGEPPANSYAAIKNDIVNRRPVNAN